MTDGQNFFDQPVKNNLRTYENIQKIAIFQGDDYTVSWAIGLNKEQGLDADQKAIQKN